MEKSRYNCNLSLFSLSLHSAFLFLLFLYVMSCLVFSPSYKPNPNKTKQKKTGILSCRLKRLRRYFDSSRVVLNTSVLSWSILFCPIVSCPVRMPFCWIPSYPTLPYPVRFLFCSWPYHANANPRYHVIVMSSPCQCHVIVTRIPRPPVPRHY